MSDRKSTFWAGVFFLIGVVLFLIMFFTLTDFRTKARGYPIRVKFKFVAGLNVGAPVRLAGMEIGEVRDLRLEDEYVIARLWVRKTAKIPKTANITINTLGLIGERYVEIDVQEIKPPFLSPNEEIRGVDPVATARIYLQSAELIDSIKESINQINALLRDRSFQDNVSAAFSEISRFLENLNALLSQSSKNIRASNRDLAETMKNVRELTYELKTTLPATVKQINTTYSKIDGLAEELSDTLPAVLNSLTSATDKLQKLLERVEKGEGSLGKFINDEELYNNMNEFSRKIKEKPWLLLKKK